MTTIDPTDSVRDLLKQRGPLSTKEIEETLENLHHKREVEEALDFWRREHAATHDADGVWSWRGMPGE